MRIRLGLFAFTLGMLYLLAHVLVYIYRSLEALNGGLG